MNEWKHLLLHNIRHKYRQKTYTSQYFSPSLKNLVALPCETKILKSEFALPILDNKAMPDFYYKFVNC